MGDRGFIFNTKLGWAGISATEKGLKQLVLPQKDRAVVSRKLATAPDAGEPIPDDIKDIIERLQQYFTGYKVVFPDALDLTGATDFQRCVWEATREIPYGETRSYSWVAEHIGNASAVRATGNALGKNPLPVIIPCHRVLHRDGGLGGYTGGIDIKRYLLRLEASSCMRNKTVAY